MANLIRYEPYELGLEPFDDLFRGFFRPVRLEKDLPQIKVDVKEDNKAYTVHADLPGLKKEDIQVTIDGQVVTVTAETRRESEQKDGEKMLRRERYFGKVSRSFSLDTDVDEKGASAKYTDGVLELRLPKKAASSQKRLEIH
ncbi:MAG: Hsp20/alpha crystallin family protein [Thiobacillaceae bacterium]